MKKQILFKSWNNDQLWNKSGTSAEKVSSKHKHQFGKFSRSISCSEPPTQEFIEHRQDFDDSSNVPLNLSRIKTAPKKHEIYLKNDPPDGANVKRSAYEVPTLSKKAALDNQMGKCINGDAAMVPKAKTFLSGGAKRCAFPSESLLCSAIDSFVNQDVKLDERTSDVKDKGDTSASLYFRQNSACSSESVDELSCDRKYSRLLTLSGCDSELSDGITNARTPFSEVDTRKYETAILDKKGVCTQAVLPRIKAMRRRLMSQKLEASQKVGENVNQTYILTPEDIKGLFGAVCDESTTPMSASLIDKVINHTFTQEPSRDVGNLLKQHASSEKCKVNRVVMTNEIRRSPMKASDKLAVLEGDNESKKDKASQRIIGEIAQEKKPNERTRCFPDTSSSSEVIVPEESTTKEDCQTAIKRQKSKSDRSVDEKSSSPVPASMNDNKLTEQKLSEKKRGPSPVKSDLTTKRTRKTMKKDHEIQFTAVPQDESNNLPKKNVNKGAKSQQMHGLNGGSDSALNKQNIYSLRSKPAMSKDGSVKKDFQRESFDNTRLFTLAEVASSAEQS